MGVGPDRTSDSTASEASPAEGATTSSASVSGAPRPLPRRRRWLFPAALTTLLAALGAGAFFARSGPVGDTEPGEGITAASCPPDMVFVPGGAFLMGSDDSPEGMADDERPAHHVTLRGFCIGRTELTQAGWKAVMGTNPSFFKQGDKLPVETLSWFDAVAYCNRRSQAEGLRAAYEVEGKSVLLNPAANGYRLPTEAEWEYAARGGTAESAYGPLDEIAWHDANSGGQPHEVGTKRPNAYGLHDMLGNVWEWVGDWYGEYPANPSRQPTGPASGAARVLRGGSWAHDGFDNRVTSRVNSPPKLAYGTLGFRPVRALR